MTQNYTSISIFLKRLEKFCSPFLISFGYQLGFPIKKKQQQVKNSKRAVGDGKREKAGAFLPARFPSSLSPASSRHKEDLAIGGERAILPKSGKAREKGIFEIT